MSYSTMEKNLDLSSDLENWMSNLPIQLRSVSIIHLAIPGSHDSMTYSITGSSKLAPDAEPFLQKLKWLGPCLTHLMARWSITQSLDTTKQLHMGIRYFDLRIATREDQIYFVHGLYADDVRGPLDEIKSFLETHPREVVILDCQHFYDFGPSDHEKFMLMITSTFGHKLLPYNNHMDHLTLEYLTTQFRYQVICIYRSDAARFGQPLLWPSKSWPTPWPNTDSIPKLIHKLDNDLKFKREFTGYISQCILTPQKIFVLKHMFGSLKKSCAIPAERPIHNWIEKQLPGDKGVNIIITDFVDMTNSDFCKLVIGLNAKLLDKDILRSTTIKSA